MKTTPTRKPPLARPTRVLHAQTHAAPPHALSEAERCIPTSLHYRLAALSRLCCALARDLQTARCSQTRPTVQSAFLDGQALAIQQTLYLAARNLSDLAERCR